MSASNLVAASLGLIMASSSLLALPLVLQSFQRVSLEVQLEAPEVSPDSKLHFSAMTTGSSLTVEGLPYDETAAVTPGLHHLQWKREYGGGHSQVVGHTQLVGPFQDSERPPCSLWLLVDQSFLDDGAGGKGTLAHLLKTRVEHELRGYKVWPLGAFEAVESVAVSWVPWDRDKLSLFKSAYPDGKSAGHLHIVVRIIFDNGDVPVVIMVRPELAEGSLKLDLQVSAAIDLDSRIYQWVADLFGGSSQAGVIIKQDLDKALRGVLDRPPPLALDETTSLEFEFCDDEEIFFSPKGFVAVPLALSVAEGISAPLSPAIGKPLDLAMQAPLGLDIDQNGLNALLQRLWSSKMLDRYLADEFVSAFNEQETVRNFLSLRLQSARFHLPPTLSFQESDRFKLKATASIKLQDGALMTPARIFTELSFSLQDTNIKSELLPAELKLGAIDLTCLQEPGLLKPCYSDIVAQVLQNREPLQEALSKVFTNELRKLIIGRHIGDSRAPGQYEVEDLLFRTNGRTLRANLKGRILSQ